MCGSRASVAYGNGGSLNGPVGAGAAAAWAWASGREKVPSAEPEATARSVVLRACRREIMVVFVSALRSR
jgi:hypothetical protein